MSKMILQRFQGFPLRLVGMMVFAAMVSLQAVVFLFTGDEKIWRAMDTYMNRFDEEQEGVQ